MRFERTLLGVALLLAARAALAAPPVVARRVPDGSVNVDGVATESAWKSANWYDGFVQRDPKEGAAPSERTRVAVIYRLSVTLHIRPR